MVSLPDHSIGAPSHPPRRAAPRRHRSTWLVLSDTVQLQGLAQLVPSVDVVIVHDPAGFLRALGQLRPRIVVCVEPPADQLVLRTVADERQRRAGVRAMHLAPGDAVTSRLEALAVGFDDALATTVSLAELAGRLAWLDERASVVRPAASVIQVTDDLVLDLDARALWRDGTQVHLRPKEFALLRLMASNPGRAMARNELLASVWGPKRAADSRTVDVHMRWLRAKIEPNPEHAVHLVTVRGIGYRFDPPR